MSTDSPERSLSRRLASTLAASMVGCIVAFAAGEVMMRLVAPPLFNHEMRIYDEELGWRSKPNLVHYRQVEGHGVRFETNEMGFRDRNQARNRVVPGEEQLPIRRIQVYGDSFTESAQVELHESYWSLLRDRLNARDDGSYWEVESLGVGDWGTTQEVLAYERYGYPTDYVILQVFPLNDIVNNSLAAANLASSQDAYRPYLDPEDDYRSVTYVNPKTTWWRQHSRLARFVMQLATAISGPWGDEKLYPSLLERKKAADEFAKTYGIRGRQPFASFLLNTFTVRPEQFDIIKVGWDATDIAIRRFAKLAEGRGAELLVLVTPHNSQILPEVVDFKKNVPFNINRHYAEMRIRNLVEDLDHVTVIEMVKLFEDNRSVVLPFVQGHFNRPTHELVADRLAQAIPEAAEGP
ncbi:MAG: hypothetical protein AAGM22_04155 [Acidobacteriota bacterium]